MPRAERYAVHKLIVAVERVEQAKSPKDVLQAQTLIEILAAKRPAELAAAWRTAWNAGDRWREKLEAGHERLPTATKEILADILERKRKTRRRD